MEGSKKDEVTRNSVWILVRSLGSHVPLGKPSLVVKCQHCFHMVVERGGWGNTQWEVSTLHRNTLFGCLLLLAENTSACLKSVLGSWFTSPAMMPLSVCLSVCLWCWCCAWHCARYWGHRDHEIWRTESSNTMLCSVWSGIHIPCDIPRWILLPTRWSVSKPSCLMNWSVTNFPLVIFILIIFRWPF